MSAWLPFAVRCTKVCNADEAERLIINFLASDDLDDLHRMDTDLSVRRYINGKASSLDETKNISQKILLATVQMDMVAMQFEIGLRMSFWESADSCARTTA